MTNSVSELVSVRSQLDGLEKRMLDGSFGPALQRTYEMLCAREEELMHRAQVPAPVTTTPAPGP